MTADLQRPRAALWAAWALLSAAAWGALWFVTTQQSSVAWAFSSVATPLWMLYVRMWIAPAVGLAALVLPVIALIALLFRRFHVTALVGIAASAALLFAYAGLEAYWTTLPAEDFPPGWPASEP